MLPARQPRKVFQTERSIAAEALAGCILSLTILLNRVRPRVGEILIVPIV
jgi:hypothetical protein